MKDSQMNTDSMIDLELDGRNRMNIIREVVKTIDIDRELDGRNRMNIIREVVKTLDKKEYNKLMNEVAIGG